MSYSLLRVADEGVVLYAGHAERLSAGDPDVAAAFARFASEARPGVYALRVKEGRLEVEPRPGSRLMDGMPVRFAPSPVADRVGAFPKPASPGPYDGVRQAGMATLLTSAAGDEIYEACSAAVLVWDGEGWLAPPEATPRVRSVSEQALAAAGLLRRAPLRVEDVRPLVLVNAVKGACVVDVPGRAPVPRTALDSIERVLRASTRR